MAKDQSFDIVCKVDMPEVLNAVNQTTAEIKQRYDFKDTKTEVSLDIKSSLINILGQSEPQLKTIIDILQSKLIKRKVPIKVLQYGKPEVASGGMVRQSITLQQGIPSEKAKENATAQEKQSKSKPKAAALAKTKTKGRPNANANASSGAKHCIKIHIWNVMG